MTNSIAWMEHADGSGARHRSLGRASAHQGNVGNGIAEPNPHPCIFVVRDKVQFADESPDDEEHASPGTRPWVILIVDDDPDVHDATMLALGDERILGRPLEFLHAYAASEARQQLATNRDIAVVLLDVIMETPAAGLDLIPVIREELGRSNVKIILRTGQPGQAPEASVRNDFAIDGYLTKSRLTRALLLEALTQALGGSARPGDREQH
jgi:CheY-like chemotaxis protein